MFQNKRYLYLDEAEFSILIKSLVRLKNTLIHQDRYTDCVDDLILKALAAPTRKV